MYTEKRAPSVHSPPKGFKVIAASSGFVEIEYRRTGMKAMNGFLIVWLTIWTAACVFLLHSYLNGGVMDDGDPMPFWFVAVFWAAELLVGWFLLYSLFCRKVFKIDYQALSMDVNVLGLRWRKSLQLKSVIELQQVQDGGKGEDSFPSWGLKAIGEEDHDTKVINLISRQPHSRSIWLGTVLAEQLNVPFKRV